MIKKIFKLQKKHLAFFTIVPLLLTTAVIRVPCPVCEGKGTVSNTGMNTVRVIDVASTIKDVYVMDTCLNYRIYNVDVKVTLQNDSTERRREGLHNTGADRRNQGEEAGRPDCRRRGPGAKPHRDELQHRVPDPD